METFQKFDFIDVDALNHEQWHSFVMKHPEGTVFQTPEMFDVFAHTRNFEPSFTCLMNGSRFVGLHLAFIQRESIGGLLEELSGRCMSFGGPLIANDLSSIEKEQVLSELLSFHSKKLGKRVLYTQLTNLWNTSDCMDTYFQNNWK